MPGWFPKYVDQSGAPQQNGLFRGLAAWSGFDPLNEERGKSWIEADYGKPLTKDKKDWASTESTPKGLITLRKGRNEAQDLQLPGLLTKEQMQKELDSGKLKLPAPKK